MDKSIISLWGVPQCIKEIKERKVSKEVANAKWMRVICFIGPIVVVLLFFSYCTPNTTSCSYEQKIQHSFANGVICVSALPFLLPYSIIRLRETKKGKCSLIFKETYQRCVKLLNPYKKSSAYGPSSFIPPIIGFKQWEFAYWLDSFSKTFLMSTNKPFQRWIVHYKTSQTAFIPNIQSHF